MVGWGVDEIDVAEGVVSQFVVIAADVMIRERLVDVMIDVMVDVVIGEWLIKQDMLVFIAVNILSAIESTISLSVEAVIVNLAEATLVLAVTMLLSCIIL